MNDKNSTAAAEPALSPPLVLIRGLVRAHAERLMQTIRKNPPSEEEVGTVIGLLGAFADPPNLPEASRVTMLDVMLGIERLPQLDRARAHKSARDRGRLWLDAIDLARAWPEVQAQNARNMKAAGDRFGWSRARFYRVRKEAARLGMLR